MAIDYVTTRGACGHRRYRAPRAFTLMELIVVIGIIGLIVTIVVPTIENMFAAGADAEAYNILVAQLTAARAQAIRGSKYVGVHVQMADANALPELADVCYTAVFYYDQASGKFKQDDGFDLRRMPGNMAFGELTSAFVGGSGDYQNLDDPSFTTFTVVFSPFGSAVKQVKGGSVPLDVDGPLFTGSNRVWDPLIAADELGATALTIFDYAKFAHDDWNNDGSVDASDRAEYLARNNRFLTINIHTGQLE